MDGKKHEIWALGSVVVTLLVLFSLVSFDPSDPRLYNSAVGHIPHNLVGAFGANVAWCLLFLFGLGAYAVPASGFWLSWTLLRGAPLFPHGRVQVFGSCMLALSFVTLLALPALPRDTIRILGKELFMGGHIGSTVGAFLVSKLQVFGAYVVVVGAFLIALTISTPFSLKALLGWTFSAAFSVASKASGALVHALFRRRAPKADQDAEGSLAGPAGPKRAKASRNGKNGGKAVQAAEELSEPSISPPQAPKMAKRKPKNEGPAFQVPAAPSAPGQYVLPAFELLDSYDEEYHGPEPKTLEKNARILEEKLADFGVQGQVVDICPGPVITMYEYKPAPGIKISRIVSLSDDLSMALRAISIRVIAPIPGKAAIGIEVPNAVRDLVSIRAVLEDSTFSGSSQHLTIALGKDTMGQPTMANLAKMPHLLIAGATGTGKSVCINTVLSSLLYRNTPDELRLLLVDPKRIELSSYEGIPHLIHPVVTDAKLSTRALQWAVKEMELRYKLLADKNARNIEGYNKALALEKEKSNGGPAPEEGSGPQQHGSAEAAEGEPELRHHHLPYIVIIIDELADLMMVASREVEESIMRLAQMARAAGIHLILATQRPSVDVLTGVIKANIPTRISFQVSSRIDSRTILDTMGAESLLGSGDMLFLPPGTAKLQRIHGAFISETEVQRLTQFWRAQQLADDPLRERVNFQDQSAASDISDDELDEKYEEAIRLVQETRQASISMLQRRLRVGYNRAARMIEMMEQQGIVGPSDGVKPREVFGPRLDS